MYNHSYIYKKKMSDNNLNDYANKNLRITYIVEEHMRS